METCTHTDHNYTCVVVYSYPKSKLMANQCPFCAAEIRIKELMEELADAERDLKSAYSDLQEVQAELHASREQTLKEQKTVESLQEKIDELMEALT